MRIARVLTAAIALVAMMLAGVSNAATSSATNAQLAQDLRSESRDARYSALHTLAQRNPATLEPQVRTAMIALLDELNAQAAAARASESRLPNQESGEFMHAVAKAVAQLEDVSSIPSLARAVHGGRPVALQLARFGERALPAVVSAMEEPGAHHYQVEFSLSVLMHMLQVQGDGNLSPAAMVRIRSVVKEKLTSKVYFATVLSAIRVAAELRDPEITTVLRQLANDPEESRRRGLDERTIATVQSRAADAVAKITGGP
jgi:hypothetical protein